MRKYITAVAFATTAVFAAGCDIGLPAGRSPHVEGNRLDMVDQPRPKPQGGMLAGALAPPPGSVAVGEVPYPFAQDQAEQAGAALVNPLEPTPAVLAHGKFVYEGVCITCHGPRGAGDGHLTALFPKPPSLMTQRVRDWPDGQLFHRPMRGQGSMPSHSRQVDANDVWSVVHYIRQMQSVEAVAPAASAAPVPGAATAGQASASAAPVPGAATAGQGVKP
ncbi:MAG: cytochrome c [Vicinamibacterales bacterium]